MKVNDFFCCCFQCEGRVHAMYYRIRFFPLRVLDHFTEKSFYRIFLTERYLAEHHLTEKPFDWNNIWPYTVWPNAVWPKHHLTESPFNPTSFDRKFILPKGHMTDFFFRKWSLDRINLRQKNSFDWKKIAQKVVWPKIHLTKSSFDRKVF
jgi:hypothetical protein